MITTNLRATVPFVLGWGLLLGCTAGSEDRTIDVVFDGETCQARGPEILEAGELTVNLEKRSEGVIIIDVYRLDEGKTWSDTVSHFGPSGSFALPPKWAYAVSGRDVRGDLYDRRYELEPGNYGIVCLYMGIDANSTWPAASIEIVD
jgi:hypothetical protein